MATEQEAVEMYHQAVAEGKTNRAAAIAERLGYTPQPQESQSQPVPDDWSEEEAQADLASVVSATRPYTAPVDALIPAPVAELGSAAARGLTEGIDFLNIANPISRLMGNPLPTLTEAYENVPGSEGGYMEPGTARNVVRGAGGALPAALGMAPASGRNVARPAGAVMEWLGLGAKAPAAAASGAAIDYSSEIPRLLEPGASPAPSLVDNAVQARREPVIGALIDENPESVRRYGYRRDPYTGQVVSDPAQRQAGKQGLPKGIVTTVEASTPETRSRLIDMLDIVEESKDNARFSVTNRPLDVAGNALAERFRIIEDVNRRAGSEIDQAAQDLIGQQVDVSGAFNRFADQLDRMGVGVTRGADGQLTVIDQGSDIMGLDAPTRALQRLLERVDGIENMDAYELHRLKRYIDENVSYGKGAEGLTGKVENIVKGLRRDIDSALDAEFPIYNRANTEYSETRDILDEFARLGGSGVDPSSPNYEKRLGTLLRRVLSNAVSRESMLDLTQEADSAAKRYTSPSGSTSVVPYAPSSSPLIDSPASLDDDVLTQVLFADELDRLFGTNARTSFAGDISKQVERGIDTMASPQNQTFAGMLLEGGKTAADYARGINEENAMEALRQLLRN